MRKLLFLSFFLGGIVLLLVGAQKVGSEITNKPVESHAEEEKVVVVNSWFPSNSQDLNLQSVNIGASSAILVNYDTGEVLYAKSADHELPAASTIKVMTALVALDEVKLPTAFTVSNKAATVGEDTMGLTESEKVKFSDLMYGLMLPSGNDAAVAIAEGVAGSEDAFVSKMNRKLKELGLTKTKFINASGLDVDGESQYSTAFDLATISRYTWEKHLEFRRVAQTDYRFIEATQDHKAYELYNDTNLLTTYPGVKGIKPGFTWEAGYCLVTYAENNGVKLIAVLLNSQDRRAEMTKLLDYGFNKYGVSVSHPELDLE